MLLSQRALGLRTALILNFIRFISLMWALLAESHGEEKLPVYGKVRVLRFQTLFNGGRWWAAASLFEAFGRKQIALYLWFRRGVLGRDGKSLFSDLGRSWRMPKM